jgi:hypothetical protein
MESDHTDPVQETFAFIAEDTQAVPLPEIVRDARAEQLMPLEAAAKRIFVRANGLPAYKKATGFLRRRTD